jgi:hypothetical protein
VSIKDTATDIYLLVIWNDGNIQHNFCVCLIECTDDFTWDEDKLWALHRKYNEQLHENYQSNIITWSMHSNIVLKTELDVKSGSDSKLDIVISEGTGVHDMKEPMKIDPKRLVLSLLMLIILMYIVSLSIESLFKLNIYNQCSNIDLVSPTYAAVNKSGCYRTPRHKVYAGDTVRSGFMIRPDGESYGALIYRLQRQSHESTKTSEDTSSTVHLLVVWKIPTFEKLYADVLLVKHDKEFNWNKDDLTDLYHENVNQFRLFSDSTIETWSLDDNIALMTTFEIMHESHTLNINISEVEEYDDVRAPVHIDLER